MLKLFIFLGLLYSFTCNLAHAETNPSKCFDMGFAAASKAYNAGDKNAFDLVSGISASEYKKSPCCQDFTNNPIGCMGYMAAFKAVLQGGPNKNSYAYYEQYNMVKMLELSF